ncbi:MAG: glycosyltransferase [Trueperaceae bacterium]
MKIVVIANRIFPIPAPGVGGIERGLAPFLADLASQGHEVTLFTCGGSDVPGVEVIPLVEPRDNLTFDDYLGMSLAQVMDAYDYIVKHDIRPDVVHDNTGYGMIRAKSLSSRCPVVVTLHNGLSQARMFGSECTESYNVALTDADRKILQAAGIPVERYIYYGIDLLNMLDSPLQPKTNKYVWMGRMYPSKGPDLVIQAVLKARQAGANIQLVLAGQAPEGQYAQWHQERILPFVDGVNITHIGTINDAQKPAFYAGASGFIMANRCYDNSFSEPWNEPFGVVMAESLAFGVSVVGTSGGSIPEVIADCGIILQATSDEEVVDELAEILLSGSLQQISAEACRERARYFLPGRMTQEYLEFYQHAIEQWRN